MHACIISDIRILVVVKLIASISDIDKCRDKMRSSKPCSTSSILSTCAQHENSPKQPFRRQHNFTTSRPCWVIRKVMLLVFKSFAATCQVLLMLRAIRHTSMQCAAADHALVASQVMSHVLFILTENTNCFRANSTCAKHSNKKHLSFKTWITVT